MFQDTNVCSFGSRTQTTNNKHNSICSNLYLQKKPKQPNSRKFTWSALLSIHIYYPNFLAKASAEHNVLLKILKQIKQMTSKSETSKICISYPDSACSSFLLPLFLSPNPTFMNYISVFKWLQWPIFTEY